MALANRGKIRICFLQESHDFSFSKKWESYECRNSGNDHVTRISTKNVIWAHHYNLSMCTHSLTLCLNIFRDGFTHYQIIKIFIASFDPQLQINLVSIIRNDFLLLLNQIKPNVVSSHGNKRVRNGGCAHALHAVSSRAIPWVCAVIGVIRMRRPAERIPL